MSNEKQRKLPREVEAIGQASVMRKCVSGSKKLLGPAWRAARNRIKASRRVLNRLRSYSRRELKAIQKKARKLGSRYNWRNQRWFVVPKETLDRTRVTLRRPMLRNVTFVAVTGSCGKTTATTLINGVLSAAGECYAVAEWIRLEAMPRTILKIPPSAKFCALEVSGHEPGLIAKTLKVLKPQIGVVTTVGSDHYTNFRSLDATAQEKGTLVEQLPTSGTAILNADDPHVKAMAKRTHARVLTFGLSSDADIRATNVSSAWPDRLSFIVTYGDQSVQIQTQLVGDHWTPSVLAAIATGIACGIELTKCAESIKQVEPVFARYSVHQRSDGAAYILDCHKAPYWTIASGLNFIESAQAPRKTIVFGTVSDYPGERSRRYRRIARDALKHADRVVFVGPSAGHVSKLRKGETAHRLFNFETVYQASTFLAAQPRAGELIYIKASGNEHLERIMLSQLDQVVCWRERCGRLQFCPDCNRYRTASELPFGLVEDQPYAPSGDAIAAG